METLSPAISPAHCTRCKGACRLHSKGFTSLEGVVYPDKVYPCSACNGKGVFPGVDVPAILDLILTGKPGSEKRRFRASWPSKSNRFEDVNAGRAYYVWRLARFHGGADVTLPMTADMVVRGDPHQKFLDLLSDVVAKKVFGTDLAGAMRWGNLLVGNVIGTPEGLPMSAYEGGPVVLDGNKPDFEAAELGRSEDL